MKTAPGVIQNKNRYPLALMMVLLLMTVSAWTMPSEQEAKLIANDGAPNDFFGYSVAIDDDTAVVGALRDDDKGLDTGAAYVFTRKGTIWSQQAKLTAADAAPEDTFGGQVAVFGKTAVVGVIMDDDDSAGIDAGSAYVFVRTGDNWSQQAKLTAADASAGDAFGWGIAVSDDIIVVGAPRDDDNGVDSGSAYVFIREGNSWHQQAKLLASDGAAGDVFGISLALSGDTIIIGADRDGDNGIDSGSVYVFTRSGLTWNQQAKLIANDGAKGDIFGVRLALSGDTALISARRDDDKVMGIDAGSAYVFTRSGTLWSQQAKLTANDGAADDRFGRSVALSGDTAVIGAMFQDDKGDNAGSAYVFTRSGDNWVEQTKLTAADGAAGDVFGWVVALSGDTAVIGAARDDDRGTESGSAYVFDLKPD